MLVGKDWVFVENPKTASSSMRQGLLELGAAYTASKHTTLMDPQVAPDRRLKFVVVRNPFDRMVSAWQHNIGVNRDDAGMDLEGWLLSAAWEAGVGLDIKRVPQTCWAWRCNVVMRFEQLEDEWGRMLGACGYAWRPLPHKNRSDRRDRSYRDVYTPRTRQIVEDRFGADMLRWGYEF